MDLGGRPGRGGLHAPNQVVQADLKKLGDGGQVIHIGPGGPGLPFLHGLAGDAHHVGQLLLRDAFGFAELIETLVKHVG